MSTDKIEALLLKISFDGQDEEFVEEVRRGVLFVMAYIP
jgi:hypothetical protein